MKMANAETQPNRPKHELETNGRRTKMDIASALG